MAEQMGRGTISGAGFTVPAMANLDQHAGRGYVVVDRDQESAIAAMYESEDAAVLELTSGPGLREPLRVLVSVTGYQSESPRDLLLTAAFITRNE